MNDAFAKDRQEQPVVLGMPHEGIRSSRCQTALSVCTVELRATLPKILALKADPRRWYRENKLGDAAIAGDAVRPPHPESSAELDEVQRVAKDQQMMREHDAMMLAEHRRTMWCHLVNIGLGAWLVTSPFAFGLFDAAVTFDAAILNVTAERALSPPEWRAALHGRSDIVSGLLIALFGMLSLRRRTKWAQWAATLVGLWLLFAPLLFWSPSAAAYNNDLMTACW